MNFFFFCIFILDLQQNLYKVIKSNLKRTESCSLRPSAEALNNKQKQKLYSYNLVHFGINRYKL